MAIGQVSDFQVYDEQFFGGWTEVLMQNTEAFNAVSRDTLRMVAQMKRGDFEDESFFEAIAAANLISRRDTTSVAAATDQPLTQGEEKRPKINRKIGPIADTEDAFRKTQIPLTQFSYLLGQQTAVGVLRDMLNSILRAIEASLTGVGALKVTQAATMRIAYLIEAVTLLGDAGDDVLCWVMHSVPYYGLMAANAAAGITNVADVTIVEGTTASLGRPVILTDSAALVKSGSPDTYITLGLTRNAGVVTESEERVIANERVLGLEQLVQRIQGEFAYNIGVKGFTWGGGANPTDANVAAAGNWTQVAADVKSGPGVWLSTW